MVATTLVASLSFVVAARGATSARSRSAASWPYSNADLANTRDAAGSTVTLANVATLTKAWTFKLKGRGAQSVGGTGSITDTPIVVNGVVYLQDLHSNVYALSLATGHLKWEYVVDRRLLSGPGPNGVAVVDGTLYAMSPTTAFALDATTGKRLWRDKKLLKRGQGVFGIQPQVANGRVYLASQYGPAKGGGVLMALNATDGRLLWEFNTVLRQSRGVKTLGLGSGGAWDTPLVGADGSVTFGTGNPYQTAAAAIAHPAAQLYTDSDVNLDAATGKLRWYYQGVVNDFKDYDMQASPIATNVQGVPVVIGGGKMGIVYEMNAKTGALLWKTPVGLHNGHDGDSLNAMRHESALKAPFTILPGAVGGIESNMALAGDTVYVVTCDFAFQYKSFNQVIGAPVGKKLAGEVEALNVSTGKVEWDTKVDNLPLGAVTVSNDLVLTTLFNGTLVALNRANGSIVRTFKLPNTSNAPIAIVGNTVIVPAGGPKAFGKKGVSQVIAYRVPSS